MEVEYIPTKKIILHHVVKYNNVEHFIKSAIPPNTESLAWHDGYLLSFSHMKLDNDILLNDLLSKGTEHLSGVWYCDMKEYKPTLRNAMNLEIPVIDQKNTPQVVAIVDWIKTHNTMVEST